MYINKSLHYASYSTILFVIALVCGISVGIFIPAEWTHSVFEISAFIMYRIILYFTIPYLFFSLLISTYELHRKKQLGVILKLTIKSSVIISLIIVTIAALVFIVLPKHNRISIISNRGDLPIVSVPEIIDNIFSIHWNNISYASQVVIIPLFFLAIIIGICANNTIDTRHALLEICSGIRAINLKILEKMFPFFSIGIFIMCIYNITNLRAIENFSHFKILLLFLPSVGILLTFIVYPLLLKMLKVPITYGKWCQQIIPAISLAFAGGNMTTAASALLYVEDLSNQKIKINDTIIALSFVFSRVGTAITIVVTFFYINYNYSVIPLGIVSLFIVFLGSIVFSYITNAVNTPIIITSIVSLSQIPNIQVQDLYLVILPFSIMLHSFAATIDISTCGFIKLYVTKNIMNSLNNQYELFHKD